ncbi:MAG: ABC transporter substrate-binding protein [Acidobacteriota bacterium]
MAASGPPARAHALSKSKTTTLLVLQSHPEPAFEEAVSGVRRRMKALHPGGIVKLEVRSFSKLSNPDAELARTIATLRPALVITLGARATLWAQSNVRKIPLLFGLVLDPYAQGIVPRLSRAPMTGVSMQIPLAEQFSYMNHVLPDVRRIGAVYDVRNERLVERAKREARKHGLELLGEPVEDPKEVPEAFRRLVGRVDALWSFPDTTVYSREAAQFILLFSFRNRLPLMGFSKSYVRAGALFGLYADYDDLGHQLAEVAHEILGGRSASDIPISPPRRHAMALNLRVADALGTKIPKKIHSEAAEVFK